MTSPSTSPPSGKRQGVANPTYQAIPRPSTRYTSFREFYPFYLGEHSHPVCRRLHLVGTGIATLVLARVGLSLVPRGILLLAESIRGPETTRWLRDLASTLQPLRLAGPVWRYLPDGRCDYALGGGVDAEGAVKIASWESNHDSIKEENCEDSGRGLDQLGRLKASGYDEIEGYEIQEGSDDVYMPCFCYALPE
ncbi:hypothetical protein JCM24511_04758 [Saitozyma sp. JCM 24511]|nr:hypothetical protein JCM24511_04758 [Saitozyma sp. JCM 24511]